jgi:hypothetical protein
VCPHIFDPQSDVMGSDEKSYWEFNVEDIE